MQDNKGVTALAIVFVVVALLLLRNTNEVVDWYADSVHIGQRTGGNVIGGDGITVTATDDPTNNRVNYTVKETDIRVYGTATLLAGQTSVTVTHGAGVTPERVFLTPITDTLDLSWWVDTITATQFTIRVNLASTPDIKFDWQAHKK